MSALEHYRKEVRKELPKADAWIITYSAKVRLRSWIVSKFADKELKEAFKYYMSEEDENGAFREGKTSMFPIDKGGYSSPYQEMVEADTTAFYKAITATVGAVADRVQEVMMVVCFGEQVTATI